MWDILEGVREQFQEVLRSRNHHQHCTPTKGVFRSIHSDTGSGHLAGGALLLYSLGCPNSWSDGLGPLQAESFAQMGCFGGWIFCSLEWPHGSPRPPAICANMDRPSMSRMRLL